MHAVVRPMIKTHAVAAAPLNRVEWRSISNSIFESTQLHPQIFKRKDFQICVNQFLNKHFRQFIFNLFYLFLLRNQTPTGISLGQILDEMLWQFQMKFSLMPNLQNFHMILFFDVEHKKQITMFSEINLIMII